MGRTRVGEASLVILLLLLERRVDYEEGSGALGDLGLSAQIVLDRAVDVERFAHVAQTLTKL